MRFESSRGYNFSSYLSDEQWRFNRLLNGRVSMWVRVPPGSQMGAQRVGLRSSVSVGTERILERGLIPQQFESAVSTTVKGLLAQSVEHYSHKVGVLGS